MGNFRSSFNLAPQFGTRDAPHKNRMTGKRITQLTYVGPPILIFACFRFGKFCIP